MRIAEDYPDFAKILVFLDGTYCHGVLAADDEEGWVEMMDLRSLEFPSLPDNVKDFDDPEKDRNVEEWEQMKVIHKTGKVSFKKLP
jgi:hypothetical protein